MEQDVVVIGAGVQGCAVAWRLAQAGLRVLVLEKSVPGAEASSAAAGILSPGVESHEGGPFQALCAVSMARYRAFAAELEQAAGMPVGFREGGTLQITFEDGAPLGRAEVLQLEPKLNPEVRGGHWFRDEASLDPRLLSRALYAAAQKAGARFVTGQVHRIIERDGRAAGVEHERGRFEARDVVLAAGAWSNQVEGSGLPKGAVRPVRGQIALLDGRLPLLSRVVFSQKGYVVPRADGRVLCGSTMEEAGFERAVTAGGLRSVLSLAIEICPALADAPILETWSNFRPASPDGWPVLGPAALPGLHYATGHTRNGILLCPITADAVAAEILGRPPVADLEPFSVRRLVRT